MKTRCALLLFLLSASLLAKTPVILSTDVGNEIDDQWAIAYLLTNPNFDVRAIVSAQAPSLPAPSAHASYEVLVDEVEGRLGMVTHPPLFEGSSEPLADKQTPHSNAGVDFLIETSKQFSPENRLTVLTIGAATDVASALLKDPSLRQRIRVVAMGFRSLSEGGKEFNIENDPKAWQVILDSDVPVVIGAGDVCQRDLAIGFDRAKTFLAQRGPVGAWLWREYQDWYFRNVKPLRKNDFSKPWIIWDIITLAYLEGMTTQNEIARPRLADDLSFQKAGGGKTITWITSVNAGQLWDDFARRLDYYQSTHAVDSSGCRSPHS
jgi:inosine-uridine nucleoside N-ribohydrolase